MTLCTIIPSEHVIGETGVNLSVEKPKGRFTMLIFVNTTSSSVPLTRLSLTSMPIDSVFSEENGLADYLTKKAGQEDWAPVLLILILVPVGARRISNFSPSGGQAPSSRHP